MRGREAPLRIAIADDHPLVLLALRAELEAEGLVVCGDASTGAEALELVLTTHPDLALLDVLMPEGTGDEVARVLAREAPDVKVVLLTAAPTAEGARDAEEAGACAYLDKTIRPDLLIAVLERLARGAVPVERCEP